MEEQKRKGFGLDEIRDMLEKEVGKVKKEFNVPLNIVIVGFGKSGKSALFNAIFGKKIQEVGAQTDLTRKTKKKAKFGVSFTDTPGFGTEMIPLEKIKEELEEQNLIIYCLNGMTAISEEDVALCRFIKETHISFIPVITKMDAMKEREIDEYLRSVKSKLGISRKDVIPISAEKGANTALLTQRMCNLLPEVAKNAFSAKQKADMELKRTRSRQEIHITAVASAGVAVIPVPVADIIIMGKVLF